MDQLKLWRQELNWEDLAKNPNLPWSVELFREFDNELTMHPEDLTEELATMETKAGHYQSSIYSNNGIPWSVELLDFVKDKVSWFMINQHWPLEDSGEMLERYRQYMDWSFPQWQWEPKWTPELVKKFKDLIDFKCMTAQFFNFSLYDPEIKELLQKKNPDAYLKYWLQHEKTKYGEQEYVKKLIYERSLKRGTIEATPEDILYVLENFPTYMLPYVDVLTWSPELVDYLSDRPDWYELFSHEKLPFTEAIIDKHIDKIEFGSITEEGYLRYGMAHNTQLPWSIRFIDKYKEKWNWTFLCYNEAIPWSEELIDTFIDRWDWSILSYKEDNFWTIDKIKKYENFISWRSLSQNDGINFTSEMLLTYESNWDYEALARNTAFVCQVVKPTIDNDFVERYMEARC